MLLLNISVVMCDYSKLFRTQIYSDTQCHLKDMATWGSLWLASLMFKHHI